MATVNNKLEAVRDARLTLFEIITERHKPEKKSKRDVVAIAEAVEALVEQEGDTVEARILSYHYREPDALLFRDPNTIRALRYGLQALWRKEEELQNAKQVLHQRASSVPE